MTKFLMFPSPIRWAFISLRRMAKTILNGIFMRTTIRPYCAPLPSANSWLDLKCSEHRRGISPLNSLPSDCGNSRAADSLPALKFYIFGILVVEDRPRRWIHAPISSVAFIHLRRHVGTGRDTFCNTDDRIACGIDRRPLLRAYTRQNGCAVSRSLFGFDNLYFHPIDVSLNLSPQVGACASAAESNASHRNVHLLEDREAVAEAEGNTLEHRTHDVSASVRRCQPDERRACLRIKMGSALSHQIRGPQQTICTGRNCGCFGREFIVGIFPFRRTKIVAQPAQRQPSRLSNSHDMPAARDGVAERVQPSFWIKSWTGRRREDY